MPPPLSKRPIIRRELLALLAEERLKDAQALVRAERYGAAVYMGGYAVECVLKSAICHTLDIDELTETFKVHDLEVLLLYSGLAKQMGADKQASNAFSKLGEVWSEEVRYEEPSKYTQAAAESFLRWVEEVVEWIRRKGN